MTEQYDRYLGQTFFREGEGVFICKRLEHPESHLHNHDFLEIAYVTAGSGSHYIDGKKYEVSRGDLFVINYNVPHVFRSYRNSVPMLTVYNCLINPAFLDQQFENCKDFIEITRHPMFNTFTINNNICTQSVKLGEEDCHFIEELYERMLREYTICENGYLNMLRSYLYELLITIFRIYSDNNSSSRSIKRSRNHLIDKTILYLKSNYAEKTNLDELAQKAFLSKNYFCKLFKQATDMTLKEYVQKIRIDEACRLLRETDLKISCIAQQVGYQDLKFFNEVFKRITGKTPCEYRKS